LNKAIHIYFSQAIPLVTYIDPEKCQACMTCAKRCPVEAILSAKNQIAGGSGDSLGYPATRPLNEILCFFPRKTWQGAGDNEGHP
jgi:ferredoxin